MSIFTIDKFCSKDIVSRAEYNEIGLELTYSRSGSEDYYLNSNSDTLLAALVGSGSHKLNLGSMPKPGDYQALMSGINPRTNQVFCSKTRQTQLQTDNHALAGFSTSLNVEKSLSLLYATLPRDQQMKFEQAMMDAASRTIQHLEEGGHFAYRTGAQGSESHPGEVVVATYLHFTNRNQEPHLHVHAEIPNLILGIDGQWRTLDARELYRRQVEIGALFDTCLASILQRDLPEIASHLECNPERSGLVVAGIDRNTVMRFSPWSLHPLSICICGTYFFLEKGIRTHSRAPPFHHASASALTRRLAIPRHSLRFPRRCRPTLWCAGGSPWSLHSLSTCICGTYLFLEKQASGHAHKFHPSITPEQPRTRLAHGTCRLPILENR